MRARPGGDQPAWSGRAAGAIVRHSSHHPWLRRAAATERWDAVLQLRGIPTGRPRAGGNAGGPGCRTPTPGTGSTTDRTRLWPRRGGSGAPSPARPGIDGETPAPSLAPQRGLRVSGAARPPRRLPRQRRRVPEVTPDDLHAAAQAGGVPSPPPSLGEAARERLDRAEPAQPGRRMPRARPRTRAGPASDSARGGPERSKGEPGGPWLALWHQRRDRRSRPSPEGGQSFPSSGAPGRTHETTGRPLTAGSRIGPPRRNQPWPGWGQLPARPPTGAGGRPDAWASGPRATRREFP